MKRIVMGLAIFSTLLNGQVFAKDKQFPDSNRVYKPMRDQGFDQYKSKSIFNTNQIVLTFDDGPHPTLTPKLLDILKKYNAKATFFALTEKFTERNRPLLERILREGHILASHDHDHDNNNNEPREGFYQELHQSVLSIKDIERSAGVSQNGVYYRFPYGAYGKNNDYHHFNVIKEISDDIFGDNCINFTFWDIDSADWGPTMTPDKIAQNVVAHVKGGRAYKVLRKRTIFGNIRYKVKKFNMTWPTGGGVALLHDIHERSVLATEILLKRAKKEGIKIIPLSDVKEFSFKNKSCYL